MASFLPERCADSVARRADGFRGRMTQGPSGMLPALIRTAPDGGPCCSPEGCLSAGLPSFPCRPSRHSGSRTMLSGPMGPIWDASRSARAPGPKAPSSMGDGHGRLPLPRAPSPSSWIFRTCNVSLFLRHAGRPASPAPAPQALPPIRTCTAVFRNRSYEVCN